MPIENTQSPDSVHATALLALATGETDSLIADQERRGQQQLVHSAVLPTEIEPYGGDQPAFEALGFTFGDPQPHDPKFRPATLPDGWKREGSEHDMWSYLVDELGRRRVAVFYKAAFYDRRAFMRLNTLNSYVLACQHNGVDVVTDSTWATPAAVAVAAAHWAKTAQDRMTEWQAHADAGRGGEHAARYIAEHKAERDAFVDIAARHATA